MPSEDASSIASAGSIDRKISPVRCTTASVRPARRALISCLANGATLIASDKPESRRPMIRPTRSPASPCRTTAIASRTAKGSTTLLESLAASASNPSGAPVSTGECGSPSGSAQRNAPSGELTTESYTAAGSRCQRIDAERSSRLNELTAPAWEHPTRALAIQRLKRDAAAESLESASPSRTNLNSAADSRADPDHTRLPPDIGVACLRVPTLRTRDQSRHASPLSPSRSDLDRAQHAPSTRRIRRRRRRRSRLASRQPRDPARFAFDLHRRVDLPAFKGLERLGERVGLFL